MKLTILSGGVGGSKLAKGICKEFPNHDISIIVNTGDDLIFAGLHVSPDLDTVMYSLADEANVSTGWGLQGDTFQALGQLEKYGHETWFRIGDRDLATHLTRTGLLSSGRRLTEVTSHLAHKLGVQVPILPMCDERVSTRVLISEGWLDFQDYFVKRRHSDQPLAVQHAGASDAALSREVEDAIQLADLIVVAPSNPIVSIGPILAVPGLRELLRGARAKIIAVSPFIAGTAITGPADVLMRAEGYESTTAGLARLYGDWVDVIVVDQRETLAKRLNVPMVELEATNTLMVDDQDKRRLAAFVVGLH